MTSLFFLRNWPFLSKRILIIENVKCHHIALDTLHRRQKYCDMIEQNASVITVLIKSRLMSIKKRSNSATGSVNNQYLANCYSVFLLLRHLAIRSSCLFSNLMRHHFVEIY